MAAIQDFPQINRLRLNELLSFGRSLEEKLRQSPFASHTQSKQAIALFSQRLQEYDDSLMSGGRWQMSEELKAADQQRDNAQSCFLKQIRIYANHYDAERRAHGELLTILAQKYADKTRLSRAEQTSWVDNLIQEAESAPYKAAVAALPELPGWLNALKVTNERFKTAAHKQVEERMRRNSKQKAPVTRSNLQKSYKALVTRFNALALVLGDADFVPLFAWWNALIDRHRVLISARLGAGVGGKTNSGGRTNGTADHIDSQWAE